MVTGLGPAGEALVRHPDVRKLASHRRIGRVARGGGRRRRLASVTLGSVQVGHIVFRTRRGPGGGILRASRRPGQTCVPARGLHARVLYDDFSSASRPARVACESGTRCMPTEMAPSRPRSLREDRSSWTFRFPRARARTVAASPPRWVVPDGFFFDPTIVVTRSARATSPRMRFSARLLSCSLPQ